jgi:hypothetical protein
LFPRIRKYFKEKSSQYRRACPAVVYLNSGATPVFTFDDTIAGDKIGYVVITPRGAREPLRQDAVEVFLKVKPPKEAPVTLGLTLDESLRAYMGPSPQTWGDLGNVSVYYLDPPHFEAFKAELDAGGEYTQTNSWTDKNRDWERGKTFAQWDARPNGEFELRLMKEDNSIVGYRYTKVRK